MACYDSLAGTLEEYRRSHLLLQGRLLEINRQLAREAHALPQLIRRRALLYAEIGELSERMHEMAEYLACTGVGQNRCGKRS